MELINRPTDKSVENPELVEAINAMRADFNNQTQNRVLNLTLRAEFLVPALLSTKQQIVANSQNKVEFRDQPQATFLFITNKSGATYVPVFTDMQQAEKFRSEQPFRLFAMQFADLAAFTEKLESVQGFLINPDDHALPFTKQILAAIKAELAKKKAAAQSDTPTQ